MTSFFWEVLIDVFRELSMRLLGFATFKDFKNLRHPRSKQYSFQVYNNIHIKHDAVSNLCEGNRTTDGFRGTPYSRASKGVYSDQSVIYDVYVKT